MGRQEQVYYATFTRPSLYAEGLVPRLLEAELDALLLQCSNIYEQDFKIEQPPVKRPRQDSEISSTILVPASY